jgi:histone H3/H4
MKYVKKTQVNDKLREHGYNVSKDIYHRLDQELEHLVKEAMMRAEKNGRKTVMERDV